MTALLDWLGTVPLGVLYAVLGVAAAVENFFPPVPSDAVVAVGSFLAARGNGNVLWAFAATWVGNVSGAMLMYALGRRFGAARLERRLLGDRSASAEGRLRAAYGRYGLGALFFSRFVPAVRAIVPPFAGALRIPPLRVFLSIGLASGLWYGLVSWIGFRVGADWQLLSDTLARYGVVAAAVAAGLLLVIATAWWLRHRAARQHGA